MAELPYRQQGREALAPNKDPLSLDQEQETFNHGQARDTSQSNSIKLGKGSPSKNSLMEVRGADNPQLVNKENLGGKKSRIPDIRSGMTAIEIHVICWVAKAI